MGSMVQLGLSAFWKKILLSTIELEKRRKCQKTNPKRYFALMQFGRKFQLSFLCHAERAFVGDFCTALAFWVCSSDILD